MVRENKGGEKKKGGWPIQNPQGGKSKMQGVVQGQNTREMLKTEVVKHQKQEKTTHGGTGGVEKLRGED